VDEHEKPTFGKNENKALRRIFNQVIEEED
jgi:hypothetical protein